MESAGVSDSERKSTPRSKGGTSEKVAKRLGLRLTSPNDLTIRRRTGERFAIAR